MEIPEILSARKCICKSVLEIVPTPIAALLRPRSVDGARAEQEDGACLALIHYYYYYYFGNV